MINKAPLDLSHFLHHDSNILFLAPTGWGKTTLLLDLAKNSNKSIVYLSPLRALANEFHLRCLQKKLKVFAPKSRKELGAVMANGSQFKLFVLTVELLGDKAIETLLEDKILVFDEFHLFYYWGGSFRPKLLELYCIAANLGLACLCLSATVSEEAQNFWKESSFHYENRYIVNLGNQQIKTRPKRFFYCPVKKWALADLALARAGVKLVFCKYRKEAKAYCEHYSQKGYTALSCVSGEVARFQEQLLEIEMSKGEKLDFIFCTSTLSHGVNLPKIAHLYILYKVDNLDLWLQMVGRAGRRGESFSLISAQRGDRRRGASLVSLCGFLCHYGLDKMVKAFVKAKDAFRRDYCS